MQAPHIAIVLNVDRLMRPNYAADRRTFSSRKTRRASPREMAIRDSIVAGESGKVKVQKQTRCSFPRHGVSAT